MFLRLALSSSRQLVLSFLLFLKKEYQSLPYFIVNSTPPFELFWPIKNKEGTATESKMYGNGYFFTSCSPQKEGGVQVLGGYYFRKNTVSKSWMPGKSSLTKLRPTYILLIRRKLKKFGNARTQTYSVITTVKL